MKIVLQTISAKFSDCFMMSSSLSCLCLILFFDFFRLSSRIGSYLPYLLSPFLVFPSRIIFYLSLLCLHSLSCIILVTHIIANDLNN